MDNLELKYERMKRINVILSTKSTLTFLCIVFPFLILAQNYAEAHLKVHEITSNLIEEQKNYVKANKQFKELLDQYDYRFIEGLRPAFENRLCNMNGTWEKDSAEIDFYLKRITSIGYSKDSILSMCGCTDNTTFAIVEQKVNIYDSIAKSNLNKDLVALIDSMFNEDQRVRIQEVSNEEFWRADSLNLIILKNLMAQYGRLLGVRDFDMSTADKYALLIHHFEPEMILETWYDKILDGIRNGDLDPVKFSNSIDYAIFKGMDIIDGKPAVRYSRYGMTNFRGVCHPVKNLDEANILRRNIGLPPLDYYLKKNNIIYDIEVFKQRVQLIED
jgi:hypothetical protein